MDHSNQILQCLEKTDAVSVEKLAERLHISERSIRNAVLLLRKDASRNGFAIHTIRSKGYCLHINDVNAYRKYRKTLQTIDFADKSERINKIMAGGWAGLVVEIIQCAVVVAIYFPFVKLLDKQKCAEEAEKEKQAAESLDK